MLYSSQESGFSSKKGCNSEKFYWVPKDPWHSQFHEDFFHPLQIILINIGLKQGQIELHKKTKESPKVKPQWNLL